MSSYIDHLFNMQPHDFDPLLSIQLSLLEFAVSCIVNVQFCVPLSMLTALMKDRLFLFTVPKLLLQWFGSYLWQNFFQVVYDLDPI